MPPRWPWSGTNKKSDPTKHVNGACHGIYARKAPAGGVLSYMWHGTTLTTSKTTSAKTNKRIPHKPPPPAEPPSVQLWQMMHKHNAMLPVWEYQTQMCARWHSTAPTTRETALGKMKEQIPRKSPPPAKPPPAWTWQKKNKQLLEPQQSSSLPVVLATRCLRREQRETTRNDWPREDMATRTTTNAMATARRGRQGENVCVWIEAARPTIADKAGRHQLGHR